MTLKTQQLKFVVGYSIVNHQLTTQWFIAESKQQILKMNYFH
jgi:hypothetical protein